MESILVNLQKLSSICFGVNFLKNIPKTKTQVFSFILFIAVLLINFVFSVYDIFFDLTIKFHVKLQLICTTLGLVLVLMLFINFGCNEAQYQYLTNWVQARYTKRSFKLVEDESSVDYESVSRQMKMVVK